MNAQGTPRIVAGIRPSSQRFGAAVGAARSIGAGWTGLVFERNQAMQTTQRVVVYTDRTAPAAGPAFSAAFTGGTAFNSDPTMVGSGDTGLGTRYGATFSSLAASASFPAAPPAGQVATANFATGVSFAGTFGGVAGMFQCTDGHDG